MDKELIILEQIQNNPQISQRDLARMTKASLGMTNALLKRFVSKGLITIKKVNNRNIHYILTSEGFDEIRKRSWGYFKRTIKNVVVYQDAIKEIIIKSKSAGYKGVGLHGDSDFLFIIEHICFKENIPFRKMSGVEDISGDFLILISEACDPIKNKSNDFFDLEHLLFNELE